MPYRRSRATYLAWLAMAGLVVLSWAWPWPSQQPGCTPYACRDPFSLEPLPYGPRFVSQRRHVAVVRGRSAARMGSQFDVTDFLNRLNAAAKIDDQLLNAAAAAGAVGGPPAAPQLSGPQLAEIDAGPKWPELRERMEQEEAASEPEPQAESTSPQSWTLPQTLLERLASLELYPASRAWAAATAQCVRDLASGDDSIRTAALHLVQEKLRDADRVIAGLRDEQAASQARRARYALERHVAVWSGLVSLEASRSGAVAVVQYDSGTLVPYLRDVANTLRGSEHEQGWRQYLLIDSLENVSLQVSVDENTAALARRALRRIESPYLNAEQRAFLQLPQYQALVSELRRVADEPIDERELLAKLEAYESSGRASLGSLLGEDLDRMRLSPRADERALAQRLESYFRNTNVRMSISETFLNKLVADQSERVGPVSGVMFGVPYRGCQRAQTQTTLKMLPGTDPFQVMLVTQGTVIANTSASQGPISTQAQTTSDFTIYKRVEFRRDGVHALPAEVTVHSRQALCDMESSFDGVPVMGGLMRAIAERQFDARRPEATAVTEHRLRTEAAANTDAAADAALAELQRTLQRNLLLPLERLALTPAAIVDRPEDDEVNVRVRLATYRQLGAHTPRPKAPGDSLASVQLHQSALNNVLERLRLAGREISLAQLWQAASHQSAQADAGEGMDVRLKFAPYDPLQVQCQDGRVRAMLRLDALDAGGLHLERLVVHVEFKPVRRDRNVYLEKVGQVVVTGTEITSSQRAILQTVIGGFLARSGGLPVVPPALLDMPRLGDVAVTQCDVTDGWIAIALGPAEAAKRTAQRGTRDDVRWER
jgi:hypothetical protein